MLAEQDSPGMATLELAGAPNLEPPCEFREPTLTVLGVRIADVTRRQALAILQRSLDTAGARARSVYFVNAHTLNLAASDRKYREILNAGDHVFGDGTGVRWAARLQGVRLQDNVNGTDLVPEWFQAAAPRALRYFLLGGDRDLVAQAARHAAHAFPHCTLAGCHHGYLTDPDIDAAAVRQINEARPDALLVGMGNPLQEQWIHAHRAQLEVPLCLGVGGLFHYWAGDLRRSPGWLRQWGAEWLGILLQQPHKARRYLLGNPLFLARALGEAVRGFKGWRSGART